MTSLLRSLPGLWQLAKFGAVGGLAFVVDLSVYNVLRLTVLDDKPIGAKVVSVVVATIVAWLGSRYWTFKEARGASPVREFLSFGLINAGGLLVAMACLFVSHYVLGFTSQLADNISGNVVGLVLGTCFRFAMYKFVLFRGSAVEPDVSGVVEELTPARATPDARAA